MEIAAEWRRQSCGRSVVFAVSRAGLKPFCRMVTLAKATTLPSFWRSGRSQARGLSTIGTVRRRFVLLCPARTEMMPDSKFMSRHPTNVCAASSVGKRRRTRLSPILYVETSDFEPLNTINCFRHHTEKLAALSAETGLAIGRRINYSLRFFCVFRHATKPSLNGPYPAIRKSQRISDSP